MSAILENVGEKYSELSFVGLRPTIATTTIEIFHNNFHIKKNKTQRKLGSMA